jgi:hypothetical protein
MPAPQEFIDRGELENRFGFHPATDETKRLHQEVREGFIEFTDRLLAFLPGGRERALVLTHLEEASMWANAAIARNLAPLKLGE